MVMTGVYSMVYATSVVLERDPTREDYESTSLRSHAIRILLTQELTYFPTIGDNVYIGVAGTLILTKIARETK